MKNFIIKYKERILKKLIEPIRIFCFHHVCEQYDEKSMHLCDWISITEFKEKIINLRKNGYQFISLLRANNHLKNDLFRKQKYAVITFDDGYKSILEIIPWLIKENIPFVLFINGKYLDGISYRKNNNEKYLSREELFTLDSPLIEIGSHGWEHIDATSMLEKQFIKYINDNIILLTQYKNFIPYHAYTWGKRTNRTDYLLKSLNIIPVYMDGEKNYNGFNVLHRELL